jgi:hypothetical protein
MRHRHPEIRRIGDLELDEHIGFQRRSWRAQRIGQVIIVLFVLGGFFGLFGGGRLAKTTEHAGAAQIEYPRFLRAHSPVEIHLSLKQTRDAISPLSVTIDSTFFEVFGIEQISPQPVNQLLGEDALVYQFARTEEANAAITIRVKATKMGLRSATFRVGDQPPMQIRSFIFP